MYKFKKVDSDPSTLFRRNLRRLNISKQIIEEFIVTDIPVIELDWGDSYKSHHVAYNCLNHTANKYYHDIKVKTRNGKIYLINLLHFEELDM